MSKRAKSTSSTSAPAVRAWCTARSRSRRLNEPRRSDAANAKMRMGAKESNRNTIPGQNRRKRLYSSVLLMTAEQTFETLRLIEPIARAVRDEGYSKPTPIQLAAIPQVLTGRDLLGLAQTGTGKTAAFALPILQGLQARGYHPHGGRPIRVLVLTPTRELASQIGDSFATYGRHLGFRHTVIFGGVGHEPQRKALRAGMDILVATP